MVTRYALHIRVSIADDDGAEARALHRWLAAEPEVRTGGHLTTGSGEPGEGDMGDPLGVISLIVGSGISLGQLFVAIAAWRASRPRPHRVVVQLPDRTIAIETTDLDEALEIARRTEAERPESG